AFLRLDKEPVADCEPGGLSLADCYSQSAFRYTRSPMTRHGRLSIFLATAPGLEDALYAEVRSKGFNSPKSVPGGVTVKGGWPEVWRANLWIRGTGRVLAVLASFPAEHLEELKREARRVPWREVLRPDVPFRVEATCSRSR